MIHGDAVSVVSQLVEHDPVNAGCPHEGHSEVLAPGDRVRGPLNLWSGPASQEIWGRVHLCMHAFLAEGMEHVCVMNHDLHACR